MTATGPAPCQTDTTPAAAIVRLRVLATTDLHMHLAAYDYHADRPCQGRGLILTAALIAEARAEVPGSVLLDNGDFLQGSPLGDLVARGTADAHPMIRAMAHLGYDAVNLGNHDFSHGVPMLAAAAAQAPFPVISANTTAPPGSPLNGLVRPWAVIERQLPDQTGALHRLRIGVIGVLPPETALWDKQAIAGLAGMTPILTSVRQILAHLRRAGADLVVMMAHCGLGTCSLGSQMEDGVLRLADIDGIDALVMGHIHAVFPGPALLDHPAVDPRAGTVGGKPAVMPGCFGSHLGVMDLTLEHSGTGWQVRGQQVEARAISRRAPSGPPPLVVSELAALIEPAHQATLDWIRQPIASTPRPLHSFFALVTDCPTVQIINEVQAAYVASRLKGGPLGHLPVLSATAPFRAGGLGGPENYTFVPPGAVRLSHACDLYVHPNTIMALRLTGAALRHWLETSALGYRRIIPGLPDQPLLQDGVPSFLFDTIAGLSYDIDLTAPPCTEGGQRIRNLCWQGRPLQDAQEFVLASNSFRASGSGGFALPDCARVILAEQVSNRDILIRHLSRHGTPPPPKPPAWRFCPVPHTSVVFDTSPAALPFLADPPGLRLSALGRTETGFLRLRLSL